MGAKLTVKYQMMLPSDMILLWDEDFRKHLKDYAEDEDLLKKEFGTCIVHVKRVWPSACGCLYLKIGEAYKRLTELGVPGCPGFKP